MEGFYAYTMSKFRATIGRSFFRIKAQEVNLNEIDNEVIIFEENHSMRYRMCAYLLWMMIMIEKSDDPIKAARWIAWVGDRMEMMGLITNQEHRDWSREDERAGRTGRELLKQ